MAPAGFAGHLWFALIHIPIPFKQAAMIPKAKEALEGEWGKLEGLPCWNLNTVMEQKDVTAKARGNPKLILHFWNTHGIMPRKTF